MVEEKMGIEWKVRVISFHPSVAIWQGMVNLEEHREQETQILGILYFHFF